jgi:hypothetical protein
MRHQQPHPRLPRRLPAALPLLHLHLHRLPRVHLLMLERHSLRPLLAQQRLAQLALRLGQRIESLALLAFDTLAHRRRTRIGRVCALPLLRQVFHLFLGSRRSYSCARPRSRCARAVVALLRLCVFRARADALRPRPFCACVRAHAPTPARGFLGPLW